MDWLSQLLTRPDGKMSLKIGDFGEAVRVTRPLYDFTGTMLYMAPEMWLEVGYGTKVYCIQSVLLWMI